MSKILSSVLDKISENNNEYRTELRTLNNLLDEKTTSLVGEVVTLSGYVADFSNTVSISKEKLVSPISRTIESYVIRDLRSVETVNEQFVEKINDKIDNSNITSKEEKESFISSLNELLNNKYLEIVKIKRVDFFDENNTNNEVESSINDFVSYLNETYNLNYSNIENAILNYKNEIYSLIKNSLLSISNLYLNNFVNEVSSALNTAVDYKEDISLTAYNNIENTTVADNITIPNIPVVEDVPFIPEIPVIPEVPFVPEVPSIPEVPTINTYNVDNVDAFSYDTDLVIPEVPVMPEINEVEIPQINESEANINSFEEPKTLDIPSINPISFENEEVKKENKKAYDVEEILKIAKSPVVMLKDDEKNKEAIKPVIISNNDELIVDYNERELVEELINRLSKRLKEIDEREAKYEENIKQLKEDETFVNDLIDSSNKKIEELDKFEQELEAKEKELDEKQKQLDKKINDILPFANKVLENE